MASPQGGRHKRPSAGGHEQLPTGLPAATADTKDSRDPQQWKGLRVITEDEINVLAQPHHNLDAQTPLRNFRLDTARLRDTIEIKWEMSDLHVRAKTWRNALVARLRYQQLINISRKPKPLPILTLKNTH